MTETPPQAKSTSSEKPLVVMADLWSYGETVPRILNALGADSVLRHQKRILIKPNLIEARQAPITTDVRCIEAIVGYCREVSTAEITVADGAGGCETDECFEKLGFRGIEREYGVKLVDLNHAKTVTLTDESNVFLKEFHVPEVVLESYLITVPVLKAHSMADVTLGMKNMMGTAPERYYGSGGHYKKWGLHKKLNCAIIEINKFRKPDLTLIDAAVGMAVGHLWGPECAPPVNRIVASFDPVAADRVGCDLLKKDWRQVEHLRLADGVLGEAEADVTFIER